MQMRPCGKGGYCSSETNFLLKAAFLRVLQLVSERIDVSIEDYSLGAVFMYVCIVSFVYCAFCINVMCECIINVYM